jgi:hypothetical protein
MKTKRRWMTAILATSTEKQPALPFARGQRRRPASLAPQTPNAAPAPRKAG